MIVIFFLQSYLGVHLSVAGGRVTAGVSRRETVKGNLTFPYNTWAHVALQYSGQKRQQVYFTKDFRCFVDSGLEFEKWYQTDENWLK